MKYQASGKQNTIILEKKQDSYFFVERPLEVVVHGTEKDELILGIQNKVFKVRMESVSEDGQNFSALINGKRSGVLLKNETDLLLEKMGLSGKSSSGSGKVKAPMPGLIVKVLVSVGDRVEKDQVLLNFEAMKMENQLKSPASGEIKDLKVKLGDKVEKGQVLVEIS